MKFNDVKELIQDLREGKMIILVDDEDRENEVIWSWRLQ